MKSVSFKNSLGKTLAADFWPAPGKPIIIMAHGSSANRMARGLFPLIAEHMHKLGYAILAFDFYGHGESDNGVLTFEQSIDDLQSAMQFARDEGYADLILLGHSLGAYSALNAYAQDVKTMILLGALTGPQQWRWQDLCTVEQLECLEKHNYIEVHVNDGLRDIVCVDGNMLSDIAAIDQKALLGKAHCPLLIIHGDADPQEREMCKASQQGQHYLPKDSQLHIIPGAGHKFLEHVSQVIALIESWLLKIK